MDVSRLRIDQFRQRINIRADELFQRTVGKNLPNDGRGIAPDDLQNVKMKFFKAKNAVRGSGIGLAVVDEITKALGGTADITSTLGQGTTVTITLPIYHAGQEHLHAPI